VDFDAILGTGWKSPRDEVKMVEILELNDYVSQITETFVLSQEGTELIADTDFWRSQDAIFQEVPLQNRTETLVDQTFRTPQDFDGAYARITKDHFSDDPTGACISWPEAGRFQAARDQFDRGTLAQIRGLWKRGKKGPETACDEKARWMVQFLKSQRVSMRRGGVRAEIADLGCMFGRFSHVFERAGARIKIMIDNMESVSPSLAKELMKKKNFLKADALQFCRDNPDFADIVVSDIMTWTIDMLYYVKVMSKAVRTGGTLIFKWSKMLADVPSPEVMSWLSNNYKNVFITKPRGSRVTSTEAYVICVNLTPTTNSVSKYWNDGGRDLVAHHILTSLADKMEFYRDVFSWNPGSGPCLGISSWELVDVDTTNQTDLASKLYVLSKYYHDISIYRMEEGPKVTIWARNPTPYGILKTRDVAAIKVMSLKGDLSMIANLRVSPKRREFRSPNLFTSASGLQQKLAELADAAKDMEFVSPEMNELKRILITDRTDPRVIAFGAMTFRSNIKI
jgi:23S rRNA U2552 (ribose-2'-O)-methylase RlmE/FtsJ